MNKSQLIAQLEGQLSNLSRIEVEQIVDTIFQQMRLTLIKKNRIEIRGFGSFEVRTREARVGRNPKTGKTVQVKERYLPFFKVGKALRERIDQ